MMLVVRKSILTGKEHQKYIEVTPNQLFDYYTRHMLIQDAMPNLSPADREFIMTGVTQEEWDATFGED